MDESLIPRALPVYNEYSPVLGAPSIGGLCVATEAKQLVESNGEVLFGLLLALVAFAIRKFRRRGAK